MRQGLAVRRRGAPVAGVGSREELLAAYRAAGGADIGLDELRWWEILGTLRWGVICMTQAQAHLSGAHRSVELAAIGRRVCEQEWDLLLLLAPRGGGAGRRHAAAPGGGARLASPRRYGRPTASELLDAVREFLTDQVMPATERAAGVPRQGRRQRARPSSPARLELGPRPAGGRAGRGRSPRRLRRRQPALLRHAGVRPGGEGESRDDGDDRDADGPPERAWKALAAPWASSDWRATATIAVPKEAPTCWAMRVFMVACGMPASGTSW